MPTFSILVVDDEPDIRELISDILRDEGYHVLTAQNAEQAREARRIRRPDLILLDVWMPDIDGISLLREWSEQGGLSCPVVMMSGHGTIETAVEATRLGAWDFVEKPIGLAKLLLTIRRALETNKLRQENEGFRRQLPTPLHEPFGTSASMLALKAQLARVINAEAPLFLLGEAGTGKELIARYIHARSTRSQGPFVRVSISALPRTSLGAHAALFGHEDDKGVNYGFMDQAQSGVLYLDEIGALDLELQRDLAAVLEAQRYTRVGGKKNVDLDVRVIASNTQDLALSARAKSFNEDLLYLLNVLPLQVPSLRDRIEDIPELLDYYANFFASRDNLNYRRFSAAAQNRLRQHTWPGNLRELRNLVQRLLILGGSGDIHLPEIDFVLGQDTTVLRSTSSTEFQIDYALPLREARDSFERAYLSRLLKQADGSVGKLATLAGMERTHLYRKLRDLSIDIKAVSKEEPIAAATNVS
jgi:two-component system nitrogen regulation response regulator NtrX